MQTTAGLLDVAALATELNISPIAVRRLIARRRLPGTELIADGDWRVTAADLTAYVKAGVPDLQIPELDNYGGWFYRTPRPDLLKLFENKLLAATQEQLLADAKVIELANSRPKNARDTNVLAVDLKASPAIKAVIDGPIPPTPFDAAGLKSDAAILSRFTKFGYLWAVGKVRTLAGQAVRSSHLPGFESPVLSLYRSPEEYEGYIGQVREQFPKMTLLLNIENRTVTMVAGQPESTVPAQQETFTLKYNLAAGTCMNDAWLASVIDLAF